MHGSGRALHSGRLWAGNPWVPLVAIVQFSGDKLVHEHIYLDQASVLVQIGLLDSKGLPAAGAETARKAMNKTLPPPRQILGFYGSMSRIYSQCPYFPSLQPGWL
jgi:hypothetical protein